MVIFLAFFVLFDVAFGVFYLMQGLPWFAAGVMLACSVIQAVSIVRIRRANNQHAEFMREFDERVARIQRGHR